MGKDSKASRWYRLVSRSPHQLGKTGLQDSRPESWPWGTNIVIGESSKGLALNLIWHRESSKVTKTSLMKLPAQEAEREQ